LGTEFLDPPSVIRGDQSSEPLSAKLRFQVRQLSENVHYTHLLTLLLKGLLLTIIGKEESQLL
jgi:hypothetical protein